MLTNRMMGSGAAWGSPAPVRFLTSTLLIYPEIGTVRLADGCTTLVIEFFLKCSMETSVFRECVRELRESYGVFASLSNINYRLLQFRRSAKSFTASRSSEILTAIGSENVVALKDEQPTLFPSEEMRAISLLPNAPGTPNSNDDFGQTGKLFADNDFPDESANPWDFLGAGKESVIIERDLASVTCEEISMLCGVMADELGEQLEVSNLIVDFDMEEEDENASLAVSLESLRATVRMVELNPLTMADKKQDFFGYRDDFRVVVMTD